MTHTNSERAAALIAIFLSFTMGWTAHGFDALGSPWMVTMCILSTGLFGWLIWEMLDV